MKRTLLLIFAVCLALCSCRKAEVDPAFLESRDIVLDVGGDRVFTYVPALCQMSYNAVRHSFRVHTDTMSDYFSIELEEMPSVTGERVSGDITWTTEDSYVQIRKNITFEAVKLEGDVIWLWDPKNRIQVTVKKLI